MVTTEDIRRLREETGAGVMECKRALQESGGDIDQATLCLREKGLLKVQSKSERTAKEGLVEPYIHGEGRLGVLVEVNCETDFVARNDEFKQFVHNVAMQIAATDPGYLKREDVPKEDLAEVPESQREKFYKESCLLEQPYIRDESVTIGQMMNDLIAKIGENIVVRRFTRYALGQGE